MKLLADEELTNIKNVDPDNRLFHTIPGFSEVKANSAIWPLINEALWDPLKLTNELKTPNMSSLLSLCSIFCAYRITSLYNESYPLFCCLNNIVWLLLSTIKFTGKCNRPNSNVLNFLFTNLLDNVSNTLIILTLLMSFGVSDPVYCYILSHVAVFEEIINAVDQTLKFMRGLQLQLRFRACKSLVGASSLDGDTSKFKNKSKTVLNTFDNSINMIIDQDKTDNPSKKSEQDADKGDKTLFTKVYKVYDVVKARYALFTSNTIDKLVYIICLFIISYCYSFVTRKVNHFSVNDFTGSRILPSLWFIKSLFGPLSSLSSLTVFTICYTICLIQTFRISTRILSLNSRNLLLFFCLKIIMSYFVYSFSRTSLLFELLSYNFVITEIYLRHFTSVKDHTIVNNSSESYFTKVTEASVNNQVLRLEKLIWLAISMFFTTVIPVVVFGAYYYIQLFYQIMEYCHLPLLEPLRICFVNGVFDLGHYNHMTLFKNAKKCMNAHRLIVGVMSDADVRHYKGPTRPIDPADERVKFVESCAEVYHVIKDAPWTDVPIELIDEYDIDCVGHSAEYSDEAPDYAYRTPHNLGIVTLIPRGDGVSTSKRIETILRTE